MKDDFNWEVPVETVPIPSQGTVYNPDSRLYKVKTIDIKAMTAKEEDILTSPALIKRGEAVDALVKSCVVNKSIDVNEMLLGDRNAIMIAIRITGYGQDYNANITCPHCNHNNKKTVDLSQLPIKFLELDPVEPGKNLFSYELPVTKKKVKFKFMTVGDEKDIEKSKENLSKHFNTDIESNVTSNLGHLITEIDGITDRNKIRHFVQYMPAFDSKSLRKFVKENEPGIKMKYDLVCDNCAGASSVLVPLSSEFFWPS
jgi:hypothetical protein